MDTGSAEHRSSTPGLSASGFGLKILEDEPDNEDSESDALIPELVDIRQG